MSVVSFPGIWRAPLLVERLGTSDYGYRFRLWRRDVGGQLRHITALRSETALCKAAELYLLRGIDVLWLEEAREAAR